MINQFEKLNKFPFISVQCLQGKCCKLNDELKAFNFHVFIFVNKSSLHILLMIKIWVRINRALNKIFWELRKNVR